MSAKAFYIANQEVPGLYKPLWWHKAGLSYTSSGYSSKSPTPWVVRHLNRWRRVYVTQYSNAGTAWILVQGQRMTVTD